MKTNRIVFSGMASRKEKVGDEIVCKDVYRFKIPQHPMTILSFYKTGERTFRSVNTFLIIEADGRTFNGYYAMTLDGDLVPHAMAQGDIVTFPKEELK